MYELDILDTQSLDNNYAAYYESVIQSSPAFVIVYSVDSRASFESVNKVYSSIINIRKNKDFRNVVLCANKCDLGLY